MDRWDVLEIKPTADIQLIKKAYAKKLRANDPESDPEDYQKLRESYEAALRQAKEAASKGKNIIRYTMPQDQYEVSNVDAAENIRLHKIDVKNYEVDEKDTSTNFPKVNIFEKHVEKETHSENHIEEFFKKLDELYNDFFKRIEVKNWEEIFNCDVMFNIDSKKVINIKLLNFLMTHNHLPKEIWQFLNKNLHWDEDEKELRSFCSDDFLNYIYKQISDEWRLRYCYFNSKYEFDYDKYIDYRYEAYKALSDNDSENSWKYISLAYEMYALDPELLIMQGEYYLKMGDTQKAQTIFADAVHMNIYDMDLWFYQALIYYESYHPMVALQICSYILRHKPDYLEAQSLMGKCYQKQKELIEQQKSFLKTLIKMKF